MDVRDVLNSTALPRALNVSFQVLTENSTDLNLDKPREFPSETPTWPSLVIPPITVTLGTIGNVLSGAVLLRPRFSNTNIGVYLLALALADTVYLWASRFLVHWVESITGDENIFASDKGCAAWIYVNHSSSYVSSWVLVAMTYERLTVILIPHRAKVICTRRRAMMYVTAVTFGSLAAASVVWFTFGAKTSVVKPCYIQSMYGTAAELAVATVDICLYSIIPSVLLMVGNGVMGVSLYRQQKFRQCEVAGDTKGTDTRRLMALLLCLTLTFLVCTFPVHVAFLYVHIMRFRGTDRSIPHNWIFYLRVLDASNHAVNFLLYCVSGPMFRQELSELCGCRPRQEAPNSNEHKDDKRSNQESEFQVTHL